VGSNVERLIGNPTIPGLHHDERPLVVHDDLALAKWFQAHPLQTILPYANSLIAASINIADPGTTAALVVFNPLPSAIRDTGTAAALSELARVAGFLLSSDHAAHMTVGQDIRGAEAQSLGGLGFQDTGVGDDGLLQTSRDPLASFLLRTLVLRRSLRSRKTTHYVTLRSWKKSVKDTQIAALRSLKAQVPEAAVAVIAVEIATAARELYAGVIFAGVIPIPCGNSGHARCLSVLLAQRVAVLLGVPFRDVLSGVVLVSASHPRKSAALPRYRVKEEVSGQVLVIDDVTSTGTHIEFAVKALRAKGGSPFAIAWIGD